MNAFDLILFAGASKKFKNDLSFFGLKCAQHTVCKRRRSKVSAAKVSMNKRCAQKDHLGKTVKCQSRRLQCNV